MDVCGLVIIFFLLFELRALGMFARHEESLQTKKDLEAFFQLTILSYVLAVSR